MERVSRGVYCTIVCIHILFLSDCTEIVYHFCAIVRCSEVISYYRPVHMGCELYI
ncbi:hypothetical protein Plhal703r1_c35g0129211 [Plasmopara halstedii]